MVLWARRTTSGRGRGAASEWAGMSRKSIEDGPQSKQALPANALGYTATHYFSSEASSRVVTDRPGRCVCLERQNCVGRIWGSESKGTHLSGDWVRRALLGTAPEDDSIFSLCADTAQHATDLTPSLPETSYNAALEAEFYATPGFYESGYCEGGSLQYRHHDKPLEKTHAGLANRHHSRPTMDGRLTDRDVVLEPRRQMPPEHASRFLLPHYYARQLTGQDPRTSKSSRAATI